jgi:L-amino acid N-acyltransferase
VSLIICNAREADIPAILGLHNHHIINTRSIWRYQAADMADRIAWFRDRQSKGHPVLIAKVSDQFLGFASYGDFRAGEGYGGTVENSVYVADGAQGRGVARALMERLMEFAKAQGKRVMVAAIGLPNDASVALHAKLGFEERGVLAGVGWKYDQPLDLMFMQKALLPLPQPPPSPPRQDLPPA